MHDDGPYTLYHLFRLLHNRLDPGSAAHRLFDATAGDLPNAVIDGAYHSYQLAILVDKYQCHEAFEVVAEALFSELNFPSARDAIGLDQAVQIVTAAYLLHQPRYFQLFTKCLATDYSVDWTGAES
jgi:hypothetical protein